MRSSIVAVAFFILGILLAHFNAVPKILLDSHFLLYILYLQMFLVGICMGGEIDRTFILIKTLNVKIFLVPLTAIVGTMIGILILSIFVKNVATKDLLAIGYGFGYYSLSSIYITEIRGETLGVIALLANIVREIFGLLFTPMLAKYFGKIAPIAASGATSMDTCLPIITASVGKDYAVISLFSGTILTLLVPVLITFILSF